jgi:chromosome segregation ATPase
MSDVDRVSVWKKLRDEYKRLQEDRRQEDQSTQILRLQKDVHELLTELKLLRIQVQDGLSTLAQLSACVQQLHDEIQRQRLMTEGLKCKVCYGSHIESVPQPACRCIVCDLCMRRLRICLVCRTAI